MEKESIETKEISANEKQETADTPKAMSFGARCVATVIDKIIIVLAFGGLNLIISPSHLGMFWGAMGASPRLFPYMDDSIVHAVNNILFMFIVFNIVYYVFFELVLHASPGKHLLGGMLVTTRGKQAGILHVAGRAILAGLLMLFCAYCFYFGGGLNMLWTSFLFFLIMYISVPITMWFKTQTMLDLCTATMYINSDEYDS